MQYGKQEKYNTLQDEEYNNENISEDIQKQLRFGFVRKVYGILSVQLLFTFIACVISMSSPSVYAFQKDNLWLLITSMIATFIIMIAIVCFTKCINFVPLNYILLFTFTAFKAYLVSFLCASTSPKLVLMAGAMTCAIVLSLTVYACVTKTDFTEKGGILFVCGMGLFVVSLFALFSQNKIFHIILCGLGVILFGIYLIYDTQLILGNQSYKLETDDYILGALILYVDIISIFVKILEILRLTSD